MAANATFFFTPLVLFFLPEHCHDEFFVRFNFLDVPCLRIGVSKALGYAIIAGAAIVKVPQIINLLKSRSAAGLSLMALFGEVMSIAFSLAYSVRQNFPFSSYGETIFICAQNAVIVVLMFHYSGQTLRNLVFLPAYAALVYALCTDLSPMWLVVQLQNSVLLIMLASRLLQMWESFSNGHTGQLSLITTIMQFTGCIARIFTTIQETGDALMTYQFILASVLNGGILAQIIWYWNVRIKTE